MGNNGFRSITSKVIGANKKGRYIWNQQTLLYNTTKYEILAPPSRGGYYVNSKTCDNNKVL